METLKPNGKAIAFPLVKQKKWAHSKEAQQVFSQARGVRRYNEFIKAEKTKKVYTPPLQPG